MIPNIKHMKYRPEGRCSECGTQGSDVWLETSEEGVTELETCARCGETIRETDVTPEPIDPMTLAKEKDL